MTTGSTETFRNTAYPRLGWASIALLVGLSGWMLSLGSEVGWLAAGLALPFLAPIRLVHRAYVVARIEASPAGVRVINPFATHDLAWSEIERITSERFLILHRSEGNDVTVWAVQAANASRMTGRRSSADDVADRLRELGAASGQRS